MIGWYPEREHAMLFRAFFIGSVFMMSGACSTGWQYLEVEDTTYGDLFNLTCHVIMSERFAIENEDKNTGLILSRWDYRKVVDRGRFPIRRRLEARVDPMSNDRFEVKLRIEQEALRQSYSVTDLEHQKGWRSYGHDDDKTWEILKRLEVIVKDFKSSEDFNERYRFMEQTKDDELIEMDG